MLLVSHLRFVVSTCISEAEVTPGPQLLKEQNKYDQIPLGLLDRLQRILPLANKVADEIVCEETDILEKVIPRMFEVMHSVAKVSCNYVRHGRQSFLRLDRG